MRAAAALAAALLLAACRSEAPPAPDIANDTAKMEAVANGVLAAPNADFPALTGRVVDLANIISADQEAASTADLAALERSTGAQMVIATVPSLGGRSIDDYGLALANHWRLGQASRNNGVLLLVAPNERRVRIDVGRGLEAVLTTQRATQIIDRVLVPNFRAQRWDAGVNEATDEIIQALVAAEGPR